MSEEKEAAQIAYEACLKSGAVIIRPWEDLSPNGKDAWRAVVKAVNEFGVDEPESLHRRVARIEDVANQILEEIHHMVTQEQFDTALAAFQAAEAARDAAVTQALDDLLAKIAAGGVSTPADFTAELAIISTLQANAAALTQTATADDPGPTVVPTTPVAAPTAS